VTFFDALKGEEKEEKGEVKSLVENLFRILDNEKLVQFKGDSKTEYVKVRSRLSRVLNLNQLS
jgi:hypothetical protein